MSTPAGSEGPQPNRGTPRPPAQLRWDQARQAWLPPGGLPAAAPAPAPRIKGKIGMRFWLAALVVLLIIVAVTAAIAVTGTRTVINGLTQPRFAPESPAQPPAPPSPARPSDPGPTAPPPPGTPPNSTPPPASTGLHEVHYFAGASSPGADITIRRSNGRLDEQPGLAMPLESKTGADHLTVHLAAGSEAFISVQASSSTATVWCRITIDGETAASTVQSDDHRVSTCRAQVADGPSSETLA